MAKSLEEIVMEELHKFLLTQGEIDERLPEAFDIEEKWESIGSSYLADGIREFNNYPTVSLGWMMYIGMAMARFWDENWTFYNAQDDLYATMRGKSGYDLLDEYIRGDVLGLSGEDFDAAERLVQQCADIAHSELMHFGLEPGTESALVGYIACLKQLYLMGAYVQLHRMGYHMVKASDLSGIPTA